MDEQAIVVFSGGPDSTGAALWAISKGYRIHLVTFQFKNREQYGELRAAMTVAGLLSVDHVIFDFKSPLQHFQPDIHILMHADTPVGTSLSTKAHRMPFGPGMIMATAANFALYSGVNTIVWKATKDDGSSGRFDYTQAFCDEMAALVTKSTGTRFSIIMPFSKAHKWEIIREQFAGKDPLFAETWSCKTSEKVQCGTCSACTARRVAARLAKIRDMTTYITSDVKWPLSDSEFADPSKVSVETLAHIMESETPKISK